MKELKLDLDLVRYKKYIFKTLAVMLGVCVVYFGLDLLLSYLIVKQPDNFETLSFLRAMTVFLFAIIGVAVTVYIIVLVPPMYKLITFKGQYHIKANKEGLLLLTPLDFKEKEVPFNRITGLNLDLKGAKASLSLEVKQKSSFIHLLMGANRYRVYLGADNYPTLRGHLIQHRDSIPTTINENGNPI